DLLEGVENLRFSIHLYFFMMKVGRIYRSKIVDFHALDWSSPQKMQNPTRWKAPPLKNCRISRAATFHRSGIAESHALERSIAQESQNPTRWNRPPLRNCRISRAGTVHRSGIVESHALE